MAVSELELKRHHARFLQLLFDFRDQLESIPTTQEECDAVLTSFLEVYRLPDLGRIRSSNKVYEKGPLEVPGLKSKLADAIRGHSTRGSIGGSRDNLVRKFFQIGREIFHTKYRDHCEHFATQADDTREHIQLLELTTPTGGEEPVSKSEAAGTESHDHMRPRLGKSQEEHIPQPSQFQEELRLDQNSSDCRPSTTSNTTLQRRPQATLSYQVSDRMQFFPSNVNHARVEKRMRDIELLFSDLTKRMSDTRWSQQTVFSNAPSARLEVLYEGMLGSTWKHTARELLEKRIAQNGFVLGALLGAALQCQVFNSRQIPETAEFCSTGTISSREMLRLLGDKGVDIEALLTAATAATLESSEYKNGHVLPLARALAHELESVLLEHINHQPDTTGDEEVDRDCLFDVLTRAFKKAILVKSELLAYRVTATYEWFLPGSSSDRVVAAFHQPPRPGGYTGPIAMTFVPGIGVSGDRGSRVLQPAKVRYMG